MLVKLDYLDKPVFLVEEPEGNLLKIRLAKNTNHKPWQGINLSKDATCNVICLAKPAKVLKAITGDAI